MLNRRTFLGGLAGFIAAPYVIRNSGLLMPVRDRIVRPPYDPVLISLIRRTYPEMIAFDICGVQPMTAEAGEIFNLRYKGFPTP